MTVPTKENNNMRNFLKPLKIDLWLTAAAFFVLTGFVVWIIEHLINKEFQGSRAQQFGIMFWYSFSTFTYTHRKKLLSNLSRSVVIVWVFVLILSSSYTTLSSMMTVQQIHLAISKENCIGYQFCSFLGAMSNLNFQNSRVKVYKTVEDYADALSKGSNNGVVSAIIDEIPPIKMFLATYSALYTMILPSSTTSNGFGFVGFPEGFTIGPRHIHGYSNAKRRRET